MSAIRLGCGRRIRVDAQDAASFATIHWYSVRGRGGKVYAAMRGSILMHRMIMGLCKNDRRVVDHINGDTLDNRRRNLRICRSAENLRNTGPGRRNKSGYKGVSWDTARKKWFASICIDYKRLGLGRFRSKKEAAKAYNAAAKKHYGEFAWLNKI